MCLPSIKSFYKIFWPKTVDVCQLENPQFLKILLFEKENQRSFWKKLTQIVVSTTIFSTYLSPSIKKCVLAKAATKILWHSSFSKFAISRYSSVINSQKWKPPIGNSVVWLTVCTILGKLLEKPASVYKFHYRNPRLRLDEQSQQTISLLITMTISMNIQIDKIVAIWKQHFLRIFNQKFELHGNHFILTKNVKLNQREIHQLYKNRCYVASKC